MNDWEKNWNGIKLEIIKVKTIKKRERLLRKIKRGVADKRAKDKSCRLGQDIDDITRTYCVSICRCIYKNIYIFYMLLDPIDSSEFFQIYLQLLVYHFLSSGPSCLPTAFPSSRARYCDFHVFFSFLPFYWALVAEKLIEGF